MKLLKITIPKGKPFAKSTLVKQLYANYPKATFDQIYATMLKAGHPMNFGSIRSCKSDIDKDKRIRVEMGVK